jgi:RND family efflux transporter MFP subunit
MKPLWVILALTAVIPSAHAEESSVAVQTLPAKQGVAPAFVIAYGTAAPALDGGMTLSLQQEGRVTVLAVTPGELVRTGDRLMDFGVSAAASSTYTQAVTALDLAKTQRLHTNQLLAQQLATRDQLAQADKALRDAQAALDALRREGGGKPVQTLAAPFDGIVSSIAVAQGDRLQPGAPLMALTRLDGLVVTVGLDPMERAKIHPGAPTALQRLTGGPVLNGQVARIDAVVNAKTRLVDADIAVPPGSVLSGEAFRAVVITGQVQGWLVPHEAVLADEKGAYLFQANAGKAARVEVTVAGAQGGTDVVQGALDAAKPVVVVGGPQLADGAAIREDKQAP